MWKSDQTVSIAVLLAFCGCAGATSPHLNPGGQVVLQNITASPTTTASSPASVSRTAGLPAVITAVTPTQSVSVNNGSGVCVNEQFPAGFQAGAMQYSFSFVAVSGAPANCAQTVTFTLDNIVVAFYVLVP